MDQDVKPLVEQIRSTLTEQGPLTPERLRHHLRLRGRNIQIDTLDRLLRQGHHQFRPLGDGRWQLAEHAVEPAEDVAALRPMVDPLVTGGIVLDFVAIDVETTGIDPRVDELLQLAGVRFRDGRPVAACNRYLRPEHVSVSESLRLRMGWDHSAGAAAMPLATALAELQDFLEADTAVAWNAAFDTAMLQAAGLRLAKVVDGLALTVLTHPLADQRLPSVLERYGIDVGAHLDSLPTDGDPLRHAAAHDALADALGAGLAHAQTVTQLRAGIGPVVAELLPELPVGRATRGNLARSKASALPGGPPARPTRS
jgi:DNA polymerase III epsilon subunit-like protein